MICHLFINNTINNNNNNNNYYCYYNDHIMNHIFDQLIASTTIDISNAYYSYFMKFYQCNNVLGYFDHDS